MHKKPAGGHTSRSVLQRASLLALGALLGSVACSDSDNSSAAKPPAGSACVTTPFVPSGADFFKDVSAPSGIQVGNFVSNPPKPIPLNDHSRLAMVDLDGDGYDDIVMHSLFPNVTAGIPFEHLVFRNKRNGTFEDISVASGLKDIQAGFFAFADVDNDGDEDCFAGLDAELTGSTNLMLLNDGTGRFTVKEGSGVERFLLTANAVFADFDGDGKVDVFLGNGHSSAPVKDALLFGNGDGTFRNVTSQNLPGAIAQPTNGLVACDYDDDGDLDIFVATYGVSIRNGWNHLWENDGQGGFTNVAVERGFHALATGNYANARTGRGRDAEPVAADAIVGGNAFGIDCADVTGDGLPDIWMAAISHGDGSTNSRLWSDPTQLLVNQGGKFVNQFLDRGLSFNEGDIDAAIVDFDNDGRLDLSVTRTEKYEGNYSALEQKGYMGLFRQEADGNFTSVGLTSGINDTSGTRGKAGQNLAWADIDHDGDADLLLGARDLGGGRANLLFENTVGQKNTWLAVQVRGDGSAVHRDAFGTKVTLRIGDRVVVREKKSGRGTYTSVDGSTLLFGLGDLPACAAGVNEVSMEIRWPNGTLSRYTPDRFKLRSYVRATYGREDLEQLPP